MPLKGDAKKVMKSMEKTYGKDAEKVFYATSNKQKRTPETWKKKEAMTQPPAGTIAAEPATNMNGSAKAVLSSLLTRRRAKKVAAVDTWGDVASGALVGGGLGAIAGGAAGAYDGNKRQAELPPVLNAQLPGSRGAVAGGILGGLGGAGLGGVVGAGSGLAVNLLRRLLRRKKARKVAADFTGEKPSPGFATAMTGVQTRQDAELKAQAAKAKASAGRTFDATPKPASGMKPATTPPMPVMQKTNAELANTPNPVTPGQAAITGGVATGVGALGGGAVGLLVHLLRKKKKGLAHDVGIGAATGAGLGAAGSLGAALGQDGGYSLGHFNGRSDAISNSKLPGWQGHVAPGVVGESLPVP